MGRSLSQLGADRAEADYDEPSVGGCRLRGVIDERRRAWPRFGSCGGRLLAGVGLALCALGLSAYTGSQSWQSQLLAHVPGGAEGALLANLDQARQTLGLPAHAAFDPGGMPPSSGPRRQLGDAAATAIPDLAEPVVPPLLRVLVQGDVSAAAAAYAPAGSATVIATTQRRGSLVSKLDAAGYKRAAPGVWAAPKRRGPFAAREYVALYPGGLVETHEPKLAATLAAQSTMPASNQPLAAALRAAAPAPSVAAAAPTRGCVSAFTITDRLSPHTGQLRVVTRSAPVPSRLRTGRLARGSALVGRGRVSGGAVVAPLSSPREPGALPITYPALLPELSTSSVYRCP